MSFRCIKPVLLNGFYCIVGIVALHKVQVLQRVVSGTGVAEAGVFGFINCSPCNILPAMAF